MEYRNISIPKALADAIDRFIENNPQYGYTSISGFLTDLARQRLGQTGSFSFPAPGGVFEPSPRKNRTERKGDQRYPNDETKCTEYCRHSRKNASGELICRQYFDYVPRPFNCEKEGKFAPR